MHRKYFFIIHFLSLLASFAFAESQYSVDVGTRALNLRGRTEGQISLRPELQWDVNDEQRFYLKPSLQVSPQSLSDSEKSDFDCTECYYRFKGESSRITIGTQIFNWGVTDGYNPMDVVNARTYFEPIHARKRGELALTYNVNFNSIELMFALIPQKNISLMPGEKSAWLPQDVYVTSGQSSQILNLPSQLIYHYQDRTRVSGSLQNNIATSILGHFEDLDIGLYYFEGAAGFPVINVSATGTVTQISPKTIVQANPDIYLTLKDYRERVGGTSFVLNKFGLLWKAAITQTQSLGDDNDLPGWQTEAVMAVEKNFNFKKDYMLTMIVQGSQTKSQSDSDSNMMNFSRFFQRNAMLAARLGIGERWTTTVFASQDLQFNSHVEEYSIDYRNDAGWVGNFSYDMISGKNDSPLGAFAKNNLAILGIKKVF